MKSKFRGRLRRTNRSPAGTVVLFILILISALFMLLPVLYAIGAAFKPLDEIYIFPPRLFAHNPTWNNFQEIGALADTFWVPMSRYLFNTVDHRDIVVRAAGPGDHNVSCGSVKGKPSVG